MNEAEKLERIEKVRAVISSGEPCPECKAEWGPEEEGARAMVHEESCVAFVRPPGAYQVPNLEPGEIERLA